MDQQTKNTGCSAGNTSLISRSKCLKILDTFRYPGDVPSDDFDESQGREAIESAEQIQDFVLSRIDINDNVQETPEKPEDDSSGQDKDSLP